MSSFGLPYPHVLIELGRQGPKAVCVESSDGSGVYFRVGRKIVETITEKHHDKESCPLGPYDSREFAHFFNEGFEILRDIIDLLCESVSTVEVYQGHSYKAVSKIKVIKILRRVTGFGLKETKDWVDFCYDWDEVNNRTP